MKYAVEMGSVAMILLCVDPLLGSDPTVTNQHATAGELLEAVFFVIHPVAVATQRRSKHVSAATVELKQEKGCVFQVSI
jgi:hypothetical protein